MERETRIVPVNTTSTAESVGEPVPILRAESFSPFQLRRMALLDRVLQMHNNMLKMFKDLPEPNLEFYEPSENGPEKVGTTKGVSFLKGLSHIAFGLWEDLAYPLEETPQGQIVETEDYIGKLIADEIVRQNPA